MKQSYLLACMAIFCLVAFSSQQVGGYTRLTPKQVYKSDAARGALKFGADKVLAKLIYEGKIPKHHYEITKILYAASQVVAGTNYKFKVLIENDYVEIIAEYVVFRNLKGKYSLVSSDYEIKKDKKDEYDKKDKYDKKDEYEKKDDKKDKKDEYEKKDDKKDKKDEYEKKDDKKDKKDEYEKKDKYDKKDEYDKKDKKEDKKEDKKDKKDEYEKKDKYDKKDEYGKKGKYDEKDECYWSPIKGSIAIFEIINLRIQ